MLVARYTLPAHRAAFLLGAGEEADDVVQEAFVKAFRHLSRFRIGEPFGPLNLVGADIVEVAPAYDHAQITGIAAAHVAYEILSALAARKAVP